MERFEKIMRKYHDYRPPAWAEGIFMLIQHYGTKVRFNRMAAEGDIQKLIRICKKPKLNFWKII